MASHFGQSAGRPADADHYQAATHLMLQLVLIRKRCACNRVVTALQLTRYGCCEKCVRAA